MTFWYYVVGFILLVVGRICLILWTDHRKLPRRTAGPVVVTAVAGRIGKESDDERDT